MSSLTIQFVPYNEIENLPSTKRIQKLLRIVKNNRIVLLEGRLRSHEEAELIRKTMEEINEEFKGIELSVINPQNKDDPLHKKIKSLLINLLLGNRSGFTIIGPATIIKEIKQDPDKIQLLMEEKKLQKKK